MSLLTPFSRVPVVEFEQINICWVNNLGKSSIKTLPIILRFQDEQPSSAPKPGTARVMVPDIAGLLPVYNYDEYKGYVTKTIPNCTDEEINR